MAQICEMADGGSKAMDYGLSRNTPHMRRLRPAPGALGCQVGASRKFVSEEAVAILNRRGFDAASFCEKDADYVEALPGRAA